MTPSLLMYQPIYKWRETWPRRRTSGLHRLRRRTVVRPHSVGPNEPRKDGYVNITHIPWVREHIAPHSGWEAMPGEACRRIEEYYEKLLELQGRPSMLRTARSFYAQDSSLFPR